MPNEKRVKDLMIPLEEYSHIPYWFTLRQAMAIIRKAAIKVEGSFEPQAVLVLDEKYQLMGILTLGDIIKGLEPRFLKENNLLKMDPSLTVRGGDLLGPQIKEHAQRPVTEVMSPIQATVDGNAPIVKALYLMIKEDLGSMPVTLDDKVAGMIRLSDLFGVIADVVLSD
jgi:CBS domain-containing protein